MALTDLPLLGMLKTRMQWHQARQSVLAQNVANADTPGYLPSDLTPVSARESTAKFRVASVGTARTHTAHIGGGISQEIAFKGTNSDGWETTPAGNSVVLEEQMIKVSKNQFDFQMASTLYSRSLSLLKTAIGRNA